MNLKKEKIETQCNKKTFLTLCAENGVIIVI